MSEIKMSARPCSLRALGENSVLPLPFLVIAAILSILWLVGACAQSHGPFSLCLHIIFLCACVFLCPNLSSYKDTATLG